MILGNLYRKLLAWQRYHEVMDELSALDPRIQDDICVHPCDFERIARDAATAVEKDCELHPTDRRPHRVAVH